MFNQMSHMRSQELGFDQERVAIVDGAHVLRGETEAFKRALLAKPGISAAAHAESVPGRDLGLSPIIVAGEQQKATEPIARMYVGFDYVETLGMIVEEGRSLNQAFGTDSLAALLNQSAVSELQIENPIGQTIVRQDNGLEYTVVGIVKDFNVSSLHQEIGPVVLFGPDPEYSNRPRQIFVVRLEAVQFSEGLDNLRETWADFVPGQPVQISFLDDAFDAQYRTEDKLGYLFRLFSLIALIVAGLGILGLSAYMAELRAREIGIRKALGATSPVIVGLLSYEFLKPVLIALVIAIPTSYLLMTQWLEQFAYRISLGPGLFIIVSMVILLGSLVSVSIQTLRAAWSNPVDVLRNS
jgi:putative ABC transport system permease protein